jgi:hypothetical protein
MHFGNNIWNSDYDVYFEEKAKVSKVGMFKKVRKGTQPLMEKS